jgi:hypothetical protein
MTTDARDETVTPPSTMYDGQERRTVDDRRARPRGGRRAADALYKAAQFVYQLLTEPPR